MKVQEALAAGAVYSVCPKCKRVRLVTLPANCGECLMNHVQIVALVPKAAAAVGERQ